MKTPVPFAFGGVVIGKDAEGRISLTDLWKSAGSNPQQTPAKWQETEAAKAFIRAASRFLVVVKNDDIIKTIRGRYAATFGHQQVALEYAQYLSPDLAVAVNQGFFERVAEERNPDLITDRAIRTYKKQGKDDLWITKRIKGIATRSLLTSTLSKHGVTEKGYGNCTNAIYTPIFGGGASVVREKRSLPAKVNLREHMSSRELTIVELAEELAADSITHKEIRGNANCESECLRASRTLMDAVNTFLK